MILPHELNPLPMKTTKKKHKTALLVAILSMMLWPPEHAWAQNGAFDHENYGSSGTGSFTHENFGNNYNGGFTYESFGGVFSGAFTHQNFGSNFNGSFTHESFGNNFNGGFTHEGFGHHFHGNFGHEGFGSAPLGSGLLVLTLVGAGYAVKKRNKKDNKQQH